MSNNINYIGGIVRVLELPTLKLDKNHIPFTKFRVELAQLRNKQVRIILNILAWGNLAEDVVKYYRVHDYILIEGFLSITGGDQVRAVCRSQGFKSNRRFDIITSPMLPLPPIIDICLVHSLISMN